MDRPPTDHPEPQKFPIRRGAFLPITAKASHTIRSVTGMTLIARRKSSSRMVVSMLDREGALIAKANFRIEDWKEFVKNA